MQAVIPRLEPAKKLVLFRAKLPAAQVLTTRNMALPLLLTPKDPRVSGRGGMMFSACDFYWPEANFASFAGPEPGQQNGSFIQAWWSGAVVNKAVLVSFAVETSGPAQWRVGYGSRENSGADSGEQLISTTEAQPIVSVVILPNKAGKYGANLSSKTPGGFVLRSVEVTPLK